MYRNEEKEINLIDMCYYVLRQWKAIVLVTIAAAILAGGFSYIKSCQVYQDVGTEDLADSEKEVIQEKIDLINEYKTNVEAYEFYFDNFF